MITKLHFVMHGHICAWMWTVGEALDILLAEDSRNTCAYLVLLPQLSQRYH